MWVQSWSEPQPVQITCTWTGSIQGIWGPAARQKYFDLKLCRAWTEVGQNHNPHPFHKETSALDLPCTAGCLTLHDPDTFAKVHATRQWRQPKTCNKMLWTWWNMHRNLASIILWKIFSTNNMTFGEITSSMKIVPLPIYCLTFDTQALFRQRSHNAGICALFGNKSQGVTRRSAVNGEESPSALLPFLGFLTHFWAHLAMVSSCNVRSHRLFQSQFSQNWVVLFANPRHLAIISTLLSSHIAFYLETHLFTRARSVQSSCLHHLHVYSPDTVCEFSDDNGKITGTQKGTHAPNSPTDTESFEHHEKRNETMSMWMRKCLWNRHETWAPCISVRGNKHGEKQPRLSFTSTTGSKMFEWNHDQAVGNNNEMCSRGPISFGLRWNLHNPV